MVNSHRHDRTARSQTSKLRKRSTNATAGYAKRHSLKAKTLGDDHDVYEYAPDSRVRRSKIALDIGRDEAAEFNMDGKRGDDEEESEREEMRVRLIGDTVEGEMIESDDDEEIESDAAFEESDEDRFAGFSFSKQTKKPKKSVKQKGMTAVHLTDVDLNEDSVEEDEPASQDSAEEEEHEVEDEEMEGNSEDFIDILAVFDGTGEADDGSDSGHTPQKKLSSERNAASEDGLGFDEDVESMRSSDGSDSEVEDGDEDEEIAISASDDEDVSPEALDSLSTFISSLNPTDISKKRKAPTDDDPSTSRAPTQRRRLLKERTEAGPENEFAAPTSGGQKLNLEDLLAPLTSHSQSLKKSAKLLASNPLSSSRAKTLSAPLHQRTQERVDREAAYEQTKEEVDKSWSGTMRKLREAEHLSFPLQTQSAGRVSNLELAAKFKPTTVLETSIDKLLKSAQLRDEDIPKTEQLAMSHLSVEEVTARRAELRKMRELMFRAEVKAKRVSKIKSKTYRRIKKKEREKLASKLDEGEEDGEEEIMKREFERARERATLRHKNTGKWAKAMKAKGELDVDERREISEMLERGERLRRKIRGDNESHDDEDDESESDGDGAGDGADVSRAKAAAFEELAKLKEDDCMFDGAGDTIKGKSIFEMKFMKEAAARNQQQTDRVVDDFIKEMGGVNGENDGNDDASDSEKEATGGPAVERTGGRAVYRPAPITSQLHARPLASLASDTSSITLQSADLLEDSPPLESESTPRPVPVPSAEESNPWLVPRQSSFKAPSKKNNLIVGKYSATLDKSKNKLREQGKKLEEEKEKARDDAIVEISADNLMAIGPPNDATGPSVIRHKKAAKLSATAQKAQGVTEDPDSEVNSEVEEQEKALGKAKKGKGVRAFEQRDLVARAFAGDNVVQAFEDAKRREMAEDAPKSVDTTLAGWGAWGGSGTRRQAPKPSLIKKIAGIDPTTRSDFNKKHIIISEKRDKKAAKYQVKDLPFPYTSKAQFERSIDTPLGTEWNTRVGFQRGTLPKVVKKMGTIINPLEKLF